MPKEHHNTKGSKKWRRRLLIAGALGLVVFVGMALIVRSNFFGRKIVLPIASSQTGLIITADQFKISPGFIPPGRLVIRDLNISLGPNPEDQIATMESAEISFSLYALLSQRLMVTDGEMNGLKTDLNEDMLNRIKQARDVVEGSPDKSMDEAEREPLTKSRDDKAAEESEEIPPVPLDEWMDLIHELPLQVGHLSVRNSHIRYSKGDVGSVDHAVLDCPDLNLTIQNFCQPGQTAIVEMTGGELLLSFPEENSRLTIAKPHFQFNVEQPAGKDVGESIVVKSDSLSLEGFAGELRGYPIAPMDITIPLALTLNRDSWSLDNVSIQARLAGETPEIFTMTANAALRPDMITARLHISQMHGDIYTALFGQNGRFAFTEKGTSAKASATINLKTLAGEWAFEKDVTDFTASIAQRPDLVFKPIDVHAVHSGAWDWQAQVVTLNTFEMMVREDDREVATGKLSNPMILPFAMITSGDSIPFVDSRLSVKMMRLDLSQFSPILAPFIGGEVGGQFSTNLEIRTEQSTHGAHAEGEWNWDNALFATEWGELADQGKRTYAGRIDVEADLNQTVTLERFSAAISDAGRQLASGELKGTFQPELGLSFQADIAIPADTNNSVIHLATVGGEAISVHSLQTKVRGEMNVAKKQSEVQLDGSAQLPLPPTSSQSHSNASAAIDFQGALTQNGQEWRFEFKNSQLNVIENSVTIMTASANGDINFIANDSGSPSLLGKMTFEIDRINDKLMDTLTRSTQAETSDGVKSGYTGMSPTSSQNPIQDESDVGGGNPANVELSQPLRSKGRNITWPVVQWEKFDLDFQFTLGSINTAGFLGNGFFAQAKIRNLPGESTEHAGAFKFEVDANGNALQSEWAALESFSSQSSGKITYTDVGEIRISNLTSKFKNRGLLGGEIAAGARVTVSDESIDFDVQSATITPAAWAMIPQFNPAPEILQNAEVKFTSSIRMKQFGEIGSFTFESAVSELRPRVQTGEGTFDLIAPIIGIQSEGSFGWADWGKSITSDKFFAYLESSNRRLAQVALESPLRVQRQGDDWTQWIWDDWAMAASFDNLDISSWSDVVEPFGFGAGQGIIHGNMRLKVAEAMRAFDINGEISMKGLAWQAEQWSVTAQSPLSGNWAFDLSVKNTDSIHISQCAAQLADTAGNRISLAATGDWSVDKGGDINLNVASRSAMPDQPWMPIQFADASPGWNALDLNIQSSDSPDGVSQNQIQWNIKGFQLGLNITVLDQSAHSLDLSGQALLNWKDESVSLQLEDSELIAYPLAKSGQPAPTSSRLTATGNMDAFIPLGDAPRVNGKFSIRGQDITAVLFEPESPPESMDDFMKAEQERELQKSREKVAQAQAPVAASDGQAVEESFLPFDLSQMNISWDGDLTNVSVPPLVFSSVKFDGGLLNGRMTTSYTMAANPKGAIEGSFHADLNQPSPSFGKRVKVDDISAEPLAAAFVPFLKGHMQGSVFCNVDLSSAGTEINDIMSSLNGKITFEARDGQMQKVKVLDEIVRVTGFTELNVLKFFTAKGSMDITQGRMKVHFMDYRGEFQKIGFTGNVDLRNVESMPVDLNITLALGAPLISKIGQRASFTRLTDAEGYLKIPSVIKMTGTLQSPKPSIAGGDLIRDVKDTGLNLIRRLVEREAGLAPGSGPTPTPTPQAPSPESQTDAESTPAPTPTPDDRTDKEKLRDEAIGIGVGILEDYLNRQNDNNKRND